MGTAIAVITLTVPIITIAHFSTSRNTERILSPTYSLPSRENDRDLTNKYFKN
jgi:hypothetical protein